MKKTPALLATLLALLFAHGPACSESATDTASRPEISELNTALRKIARLNNIAAVSYVLVDANGTVAHESFGFVDRESKQAADRNTRFRVGSITKSFTGIAALRAQKLGLLSLDDPADHWLPAGTFDNPYSAHPLRLAQLLEHSAGWFDMSRLEFDHSEFPPLGLSRALALNPASRTSQWPSGLHHEYSNSGAGAFSAALERACKCQFEHFMDEQVFEPLGMSSASLVPDPQSIKLLAQGYDTDGKTPIPYWNIIFRAAGGLNLNPRDMAPFLQMLLGSGRVGKSRFMSKPELDRFENPATTLAAKAGLKSGYGLGVRHFQHRGHSLRGHGGDADGYLSHYAYSRESQRAYFVVITAFQNHSIRKMESLLADWVVAPLDQKTNPPEMALPEELASELTGLYQRASTRFPEPGWAAQTLKVESDNDGRISILRDSHDKTELIRVRRLQFRRKWETQASTAFIRSGVQLFLQGPMGNWKKIPRLRAETASNQKLVNPGRTSSADPAASRLHPQ